MRILSRLWGPAAQPDHSEEVQALQDELRESERTRLQAVGDVQKHRDLLRDLLLKVGPVELSPAEQRRGGFLLVEYSPDGSVIIQVIPVYES